MSPIKIVYCISGIYNSGGMERVLSNKANYFASQGYQVTIVTTDQGEYKPFYQLDNKVQLIDLNINYHSIQSFGIIKKIFNYICLQRKHKIKLTEVLNTLKADVVISMFDHDSSFTWKIKDGSKKVLEIHFSKFKRTQYSRIGLWALIDKYRSWQDEMVVRKYNRFVVLTEEDKSYWGRLRNIRVIPNANSFQPEQKALLDKKKVLAIGRFDFQKNFEDLIRIWSTVVRYYPDWILNIYGSGDLEPHYRQLLKYLNLEHSITLHKPCNNIEDIYLDHSIIAMTSRYEGLPMVLLEAQACGLPIVSYSCKCGPKDIIVDGKNGFLIPQGNMTYFADRLMYLMEEENVRKAMGVGSKTLSYRYSLEVVMSKWESLIKEII